MVTLHTLLSWLLKISNRTFQHFDSNRWVFLVIAYVPSCCLGNLRKSSFSNYFKDFDLFSINFPASYWWIKSHIVSTAWSCIGRGVTRGHYAGELFGCGIHGILARKYWPLVYNSWINWCSVGIDKGHINFVYLFFTVYFLGRRTN